MSRFLLFNPLLAPLCPGPKTKTLCTVSYQKAAAFPLCALLTLWRHLLFQSKTLAWLASSQNLAHLVWGGGCRGQAGRGAKGGSRSHGNLSLAQCPAPRGGEQRGLILCHAGMLSAFQSQLHGRAGCLRFHFRCQISLLLSLTFYSKCKCGCVTKQNFDSSFLFNVGVENKHLLVAKKKRNSEHTLVVQCLRLDELTDWLSKELRFLHHWQQRNVEIPFWDLREFSQKQWPNT